MGRKIYFAFDYRDVEQFRVNVVRNSSVIGDLEFQDSSLWEKAKNQGDQAIKSLIDSGLKGTSVTAVLIGTNTHSRRWVRYEIAKSFARGNGLLGIYVHNVRGKDKQCCEKGLNPFHYLFFRKSTGVLDWLSNEYGKAIKIFESGFCGDFLYEDVAPIPIDEVKYDLHKQEFGKFSDLFMTYDWALDKGTSHFDRWVENAARQAGKQVVLLK